MSCVNVTPSTLRGVMDSASSRVPDLKKEEKIKIK
jgi:hypothetical protein